MLNAISKEKWLVAAFTLSVLVYAVATIAQQTNRTHKEQEQYVSGSSSTKSFGVSYKNYLQRIYLLKDFIANEFEKEAQVAKRAEKRLRAQIKIENQIQAEAEAQEQAEKKAAIAAKSGIPKYPTGSIQGIICDVFGSNCQRAIEIATCESGLRPKAYNESDPWGGSRGLFQINGVHLRPTGVAYGYNPEDLFDPRINIKVAYKLSGGGINWKPWTCNKIV